MRSCTVEVPISSSIHQKDVGERRKVSQEPWEGFPKQLWRLDGDGEAHGDIARKWYLQSSRDLPNCPISDFLDRKALQVKLGII